MTKKYLVAFAAAIRSKVDHANVQGADTEYKKLLLGEAAAQAELIECIAPQFSLKFNRHTFLKACGLA